MRARATRNEELDCFVAEPVIGLAEGETRWLLAMTVSKLCFEGESFSHS